MAKRDQQDINWAMPSEEDVVYLRSLSAEEFRSLYRSMIEDASSSGVSSDTVEDIWREALAHMSIPAQ